MNIQEKLRQLRFALRVWTAVDGTTVAVAAIAMLLLLDAVADRFLDFSLPVRVILLPTLLVLIGYVVWKKVLTRLFHPIKDRQLAAIFENHEPKFNEALITSVELDKAQDQPSEEHASFLRNTVDWATEQIQSVPVSSLFQAKRLVLRCVGVALFLAVLGGFCTVYADSTRIWFSRNVLLSHEQWPRLSKIQVEGFDENGFARIAKGDAFPLTIHADTSAPLVPNSVAIQISPLQIESDSPSGSESSLFSRTFSGTKTLGIDQFSTRTMDGTEFRSFFYTIPEVLESVSLTVTAGDTRIEGLHIEVVPPPQMLRSELTLRFPEYMKRTEQVLRTSDRAFIPEGTGVSVRIWPNKPIQTAEISLNDHAAVSLPIDADGSVMLEIPDLRAASLLNWTLSDFDAIKNRKPIRHELEVVKDQSPTVLSRLDGISQYITPIALLPVLGEATDDYGLSEVRFRYAVVRSQGPTLSDQQSEIQEEKQEENVPTPENDAGTRPLAQLGGTITNQPLNETFSVSELLLKPGDRLTLNVEATDAFSLPQLGDNPSQQEGPHLGIGERFDLEVVSAARLKGILDAREIGLRQRFETLIDEVGRTRNLLNEIQLEKTSEEIALLEKEQQERERLEQLRLEALRENGQALPEPQEKKEEKKIDMISEQQATQASYNTQRSIRDSEKEKHDLYNNIIAGFAGIRKEMLNNQILVPELQQRLDERIIQPLQQLIEQDFLKFDEFLTQLSRSLENRTTTDRTQIQKEHLDSLTQLDRILAKMTAIRDQMLQMESFNEAIDLLKEIIKDQETIRKETSEERKRQLRDLIQ